ncbi:MAG: ATP synthase F1 subunit gamma [Clostridia bacterium]|nr:ATP synthase F1 subunit gamma [Clostridia bacterium]
MASMSEIKLRMKSIKETRQITKAMKLISAAKLKKARQQLDQTKPFFDKVKATIADIIVHSGNVDNIFFDVRNQKEGKKFGYIILTGDKGLAGGYNNNIIKLAESHLEKRPDSTLFVAGHMGRNYFIRKKYNVYQEFDYAVQNPTIYRAREMAEIVLDLFSKGELDEVYLIYTNMISSIKLEPKVMKLLPLEAEALREDLKDIEVKIDESLSYEPSPKAVFDVLIPKYLKGIFYGALVEAFTSEQSARMSAMDNATSNADEMLQKLNLYYNRARQAAITQEISEIVGGAAALS